MKSVALAAVLLICLSPGLQAQTVKKWVDEHGVTHYSDQRPVEGEAGIEEIPVPDAGVSEFDAETANERIQKQLQQIEQDRLARERELEQQKKSQALDEALERQPIEPAKAKKKKDGGRGFREEYKGPYPMPIEERHRRDLDRPETPAPSQ